MNPQAATEAYDETPYTTREVPLAPGLSGTAEIEFLRALLFEKPNLPFAVIRYARGGEENRRGLRLDLGKQAFLDHFEEPSLETAVIAAAPRIVRDISRYRVRA